MLYICDRCGESDYWLVREIMQRMLSSSSLAS